MRTYKLTISYDGTRYQAVSYTHLNTATDQMLGNNGKSRSIPVQTVAAPENERLSLRLKIISQSICYGICVII